MIEEELSGSIFAQSKRIEIIAKPPIHLQQYITKEDPSLLTSSLTKKYKAQLKTFVFIFEINYKNRQWELLKRFTDFLDFGHHMRKKLGREIPTLPIHKESELTQSVISNFTDFLLIFLRKICDIGINDEQVRHFLQILPQKYGTGIIYTQVRLSKLSGGRYTEATCARRLKNFICCRNWRRRYFTITDECIFYTVNKKSYEIKQMLPFSQNFKIVYGQQSTGFELGVILKSSYRQLELKAANLYDFSIFVCSLKKSLTNCSFCEQNRFSSYASVRSSCSSKYYIDGQNYFGEVCDSILNAKQSIYITGWMITPYILLRRPRQLDDRSSRLDYLLESAAQRGVKVYIIIYMEPKIALNNDSEFVEYYLEDLHRNIKVLRHPNYILVPFLWSHHEKIIIIDQKCGFLGGLDLCYGRWDNQKHYLQNEKNLWKGADFCNFRKSDIYQPRNFLRSNLDQSIHPRMPWHDVAIQIKGDSVIDLSRHFVQYWNFVSFQTKFNDRQLLVQAGHYSYHRKKTEFRIKNPFKQNTNSIIENNKSQLNQKLSSMIKQQDQYYQKFLEKRNLLQIPRINRQTISRNLHEIKQYPKKLLNYIEGQEFNEKQERLMIYHLAQSKLRYGQQKHQILRSASLWSLGLQPDKHEKSIYQAYQDLIKNAKQFIYIQNQFFICKENIICQLLAERIIKAYRKKEQFKVMILLPLLPGFEGEVMDQSAAVMRIQLLYQYQTVVRSKDSLLSRISQVPDPGKYVQILSLRTHSLSISNTPVTQILYIHTKLMIVDDSKVILGSANINDRSLLGDRDSEIGIVVEDQKQVLFDLNGRKVSKSANRLRCQLYKEHFNISLQEAEDYWNEEIWNRIRKKSESNTKIYRQVFGCYPDNQMKIFKDIQDIKERSNLQKYKQLGKKIDGSVVEWPMFFLQKQDLNLKASQKEYYIPMINFT